jgi:hypothetical protein
MRASSALFYAVILGFYVALFAVPVHSATFYESKCSIHDPWVKAIICNDALLKKQFDEIVAKQAPEESAKNQQWLTNLSKCKAETQTRQEDPRACFARYFQQKTLPIPAPVPAKTIAPKALPVPMKTLAKTPLKAGEIDLTKGSAQGSNIGLSDEQKAHQAKQAERLPDVQGTDPVLNLLEAKPNKIAVNPKTKIIQQTETPENTAQPTQEQPQDQTIAPTAPAPSLKPSSFQSGYNQGLETIKGLPLAAPQNERIALYNDASQKFEPYARAQCDFMAQMVGQDYDQCLKSLINQRVQQFQLLKH